MARAGSITPPVVLVIAEKLCEQRMFLLQKIASLNPPYRYYDKALSRYRHEIDIIDEKLDAALLCRIEVKTYRPGGHRFVDGVCECGHKTSDDPKKCPIHGRYADEGDRLHDLMTSLPDE